MTALAPDEWAALDKFELTFGIRRLSDATQPSPAHGLNFATAVGPQDGQTGQLTASGQATFPYLQGQVPIDNSSTFDDSFGYQATPAFAAPVFQTLLTGPNNSSYLGIFTKPDGREEMVSTVDNNQFQIHNNLLRHGMLNWVTRGYFLGHQRNYFEIQIDDIFLPDDRWSMTENKTAIDGPTSAPDEYQCTTDPTVPTLPACPPLIRMLPTDVDRAIAWQTANRLVMDMTFNGGGSDEAVEQTGAADPLTEKFLANKAAFRWLNHTYSHPNLDALPTATLVDEIGRNQQWAQAKGLTIDPSEVVTGEHSGLHNPAMPAALQQTGIRWIAADSSREPTPYAVGAARTVPRYPSNVYYNVGTWAEQLDEYNYIYLPPALGGRCVNSATNTCRSAPATQQEYITSEADIMFRHLMGNDPRPHFAHQSNLAEDAVLYPVMDAVIGRYKAYFKPPLVQLTSTEIGQEMQRQANWTTTRPSGQVSGYLLDGQIHIENRTGAAVEVPVTGSATIGTDYGGIRSGWTTVGPAQEITTPAPTAGQPVDRPASGTAPAPPAVGAAPQAPAAQKPEPIKLTKLRISPKRFAIGNTRRSRGATISWTLSRPSTLRLGFERVMTGKRVKNSCRAPSKRLRNHKSCVRYVPVGQINRRVPEGAGKLKFVGKVGKRTVRPGTYRLRAVATDSKGNQSAVRSLTFTVKR